MHRMTVCPHVMSSSVTRVVLSLCSRTAEVVYLNVVCYFFMSFYDLYVDI